MACRQYDRIIKEKILSIDDEPTINVKKKNNVTYTCIKLYIVYSLTLQKTKIFPFTSME